MYTQTRSAYLFHSPKRQKSSSFGDIKQSSITLQFSSFAYLFGTNLHAELRYDATIIRPTSGCVLTLKTGRRDVAGLNPVRACQPSR